LVFLEKLPLMANGKVDRGALPRLTGATSDGGPYVAPRTEAERQVASIWQEVLRLPQVGVQENFFALGGHSLLATRVVSRLRRAFGVELPLRRLFDGPTVAEVAEQIEAMHQAQQDHLGGRKVERADRELGEI
jgi:iturin family lipopeptide synthetase B